MEQDKEILEKAGDISNKKRALGLWWAGGGLLALLAIVGAFGVFIYFDFYRPLPTGPIGQAITPTPTPNTPTPPPDPTTGWRVHESDNLKFKYPPAFEIFESAEGFYTILNAGVSIDARTYKDVDVDTTMERLSEKLVDIKVDSLFDKTRVVGKDTSSGQEIVVTFVVLPYREGAIAVEYKGDSVTLQEFGQLIERIEIKEVVFCTQEAKECPDGSYVGRDSENNCEFTPCP